jgi:uncharacterized protein (TIGR02444 family)
MSGAFPEHPFWNYSLALYRKDGVERACLALQDEFGLDANLVLFCLWAGVEGPGELTAEELNECMARGGQWQREVVQRLRFIRRTLKHDNLGATDKLAKALRPDVQSLELSAEHVEQLLLASVVPLERGERSPAAGIKNTGAYFDVAGVSRAGEAKAAIMIILAAALPPLPTDVLAEQWANG